MLPLSCVEEKLLQLLFFQKELDLADWPITRPKTIVAYEKLFLKENYNYFKHLSVMTIKNCLYNLEKLRLVKKLSPLRFCATSDGLRLGYILAEYTKQIHLKNLSNFINFRELFSAMPTQFNLLDVGCGGGVSLIAMDRYQYNQRKPLLVGLDIGFQNLRLGKKFFNSISRNTKKNSQLLFIQGNAMKLPFKSQSFHIIYLRLSFYFLNPFVFLAEAKRILKNQGVLIIITPGYRYFWKSIIYSLWQRNFLKTIMSLYCILNGVLHMLTGKQLKIRGKLCFAETPLFLAKTLKKSGFHVVECKYHNNPLGSCPTIVAIAKKS